MRNKLALTTALLFLVSLGVSAQTIRNTRISKLNNNRYALSGFTIQQMLNDGIGSTMIPSDFTTGLAAQLSVASDRSIVCPAPGVNEIVLAANVDDHAIVNSDAVGGNTNLSFFECSFDFNGANQTTGHGGRWEKVVGVWNVDLRLKDASLHNWNYVATGGGNQETNRAIFHSNIWSTGAGKQATLTGDNLRLGDDSADTFGAGILSEGASNEGIHLVGNRIHFVNLSDTGSVDAQIRIGGSAGTTTGVTTLGFSTKRGPLSAGHSFDILNAASSLIVGGYIDHTDHTLAALDGLRWVGSSASSRTVALAVIIEKARNAFHPETATDTIIGGTQAHTSERNGYLLSSGTTLFGCIGRDGSQEVTTTYDGVNAPAGITDFSVIGCRLYDAQGTATQRFGMRVESGANDRYIVAFNRFSGNVTSDFSDAGTGDEKYIFGNLPRTIGNYIPAATEFSRPSASDTVITAQVDDDANDRFRMRADGLATLGDGTSAPDVTAFQRTSANNLRVGDNTDDVVSIRVLNATSGIQLTGGMLEYNNAPTLAASTTPSVTGGNLFLTNSTASITDFTGEQNGQVIILLCGGDATTSLVDSPPLFLAGAFTCTAGDTITLVSDGAVWFETSRSLN